MIMDWLFKKENLFIRIAIGFAAGIALGFAAPGLSHDLKFIGDIYLNLIKLMIIPILVCAVAGGIINSADAISLKRVGVKTVALYIIMFLVSFAVSFAVAMMIRPGLNIVFDNQPVYDGETGGVFSAGDVLISIVPDNFLSPMLSSAVLPTIIATVIVAASAPETAMTAPTERSTPRLAMTAVMPIARMITGAPRLRTSIRLPNSRPS